MINEELQGKGTGNGVGQVSKKVNIYNMGDISLDFHIMTNMDVRRNQNFQITTGSHTYMQLGGTWFTRILLNQMKQNTQMADIEINLIDIVPSNTSESIRKIVPNTFSFVANYQNRHNNETLPVWRVFQYLGKTNQEFNETLIENYQLVNKGREFHSDDILVINEYNSQIKSNCGLWPEAIENDDLTVYFRLSCPKIKENGLLSTILKKNGDLLLLTTISDLTNHDIHIRQGLSWEIITQDLITALEDAQLKHLTTASFIVVIINRSGVLLREKLKGGKRYTLFWKNNEIEDDNIAREYGDMRGLNTGLLVNILKSCLIDNQGKLSADAIRKGIMVGVDCMEKAYNKGFEEIENEPGYKFPKEEIVATNEMLETIIDNKSFSFSEVNVPNSNRGKNWSILSSWISNNQITNQKLKPIIDMVISGEDFVFKNSVPYASFGELKVINNHEIQEYREIKRLIHSYMIKDEYTKPLSIVVFGKPGTGKSYGIKQIVDSFPLRKPKILNFNLSQFAGEKDLINAFQEIRDEAIKGNVVLTIWDEFDCYFDTENFGWVKHFLSPMQDGKFFDGSDSHNIGPAIFVFIGSQFASMHEMTDRIFPTPNSKVIDDQTGNNKNGFSPKLIDFISRIQGHLDIFGINNCDVPGEDRIVTYMRRAIILRSILLNRCGTIAKTSKAGITLSIEEELFEQLITMPKYFHGVRSMESIILMSHIDGRTRFNYSCLPSAEQMKFHVKPGHFKKNHHQDTLPGLEE